MINNTDFAPTMLELAGAKTPEYMQGRSFAAALRARPSPTTGAPRPTTATGCTWRTTCRCPPTSGSARPLQADLLLWRRLSRQERTPAAWEFYDLKKDPYEDTNQYSNPDYQTVIKELKAELKQKRAELDETDEKFPAIQAIIDEHWDD